jgi:serine/threonine protein phosphatase 1
VKPLTYAIGDVHGRRDLLTRALAAIEAHGGGRHDRIIALGDYIDRGPDSRGVVQDLMTRSSADARVTCLIGNHEAMLLSAVDAPEGDLRPVSRWLSNGGMETLVSYGWMGPARPDLAVVPAEHRRWLAGLPHLVQHEGRVFVHAGLRPDRPLEAQDRATCLWIRESFLAVDEALPGGHVVHGHTPVWAQKPAPAAVEARAHRTNLDTGAYFTGVLSVGVFSPDHPGGPVEVLSVRETGIDVLTPTAAPLAG